MSDQDAAEAYVHEKVCYGGLEYPIGGITSALCVESFLAGIAHERTQAKELVACAANFAAFIEHAIALDCFSEGGSTIGWAETVLDDYAKHRARVGGDK